jgi:hypothetical protein
MTTPIQLPAIEAIGLQRKVRKQLSDGELHSVSIEVGPFHTPYLARVRLVETNLQVRVQIESYSTFAGFHHAKVLRFTASSNPEFFLHRYPTGDVAVILSSFPLEVDTIYNLQCDLWQMGVKGRGDVWGRLVVNRIWV